MRQKCPSFYIYFLFLHQYNHNVSYIFECTNIFFVFRVEKEKAKFQAEVYELLAQVENVTKEKITISKTCEKLEITISELHVKIEELNRTIVDITSHKQRLSQENVELIKEVQDLKVHVIWLNRFIKTFISELLQKMKLLMLTITISGEHWERCVP